MMMHSYFSLVLLLLQRKFCTICKRSLYPKDKSEEGKINGENNFIVTLSGVGP